MSSRLLDAATSTIKNVPSSRNESPRGSSPHGARMSVRTVCLGWHWYPYRYSRTRDDQDRSPVTPFPGWLADLGRAALADAYQDPERAAAYRPDVALINHYSAGGSAAARGWLDLARRQLDRYFAGTRTPSPSLWTCTASAAFTAACWQPCGMSAMGKPSRTVRWRPRSASSTTAPAMSAGRWPATQS